MLILPVSELASSTDAFLRVTPRELSNLLNLRFICDSASITAAITSLSNLSEPWG
jgi:hypothetical protein